MQIDKNVLLNKCLKIEQAFPNLKDNYSVVVLIRTLIVKYCVEKPGVLFFIVIFEESNHKGFSCTIGFREILSGDGTIQNVFLNI